MSKTTNNFDANKAILLVTVKSRTTRDGVYRLLVERGYHPVGSQADSGRMIRVKVDLSNLESADSEIKAFKNVVETRSTI